MSDAILEQLRRETEGWSLARLEARLTQEKARLWEPVTVNWAGIMAETILTELVPTVDSLRRLAYHESGHFIVMSELGYAPVAITMESVGSLLFGCTHETWATLNDPPPPPVGFGAGYDARDAGRVLREAESVGVHIDLNDCRIKAEDILRQNWQKVDRIAGHVERCCPFGKEWRVVIPAGTIERLFWTPEQWGRSYGIEEAAC